MNEVSPNYYAEGARVYGYELSGDYFDQIPMDAIGILAIANDSPLQFINSTSSGNLFDIARLEKTVIELDARSHQTHPNANYLGAIVSADRQIVYWVNDTNPLPQA